MDPLLMAKSKIFYYCKEYYYQKMQNIALEASKRYPNDMGFKFYYAVSFLHQERIPEAMRELDPLKNDNELSLAVTMALLYCHRKCSTVDKEAIAVLEARLKSDNTISSSSTLYYAAMFLFQIRKHDKANEYIDKLLATNQDSKDGLGLKAWIELYGGYDDAEDVACQYFDHLLSNYDRDVDATMGKVKCFEIARSFDVCLELLNETVVTQPNYLPALIEKMKIHLAQVEWDHTLDTAKRILAIDSQDLEALRMQLLHITCYSGNYEEGAIGMREFLEALEKYEPQNARLFFHNAKLFSRMCGQDPGMLAETYRLAEKACQLSPRNSVYMTELAQQCLLQGRVKEAIKLHKAAMKLDQSSVSAMCGFIYCQLMEGELELAEHQLEFLKELRSSNSASSDVLYLNIILSKKKKKPIYKILNELNEAVDAHLEICSRYSMGIAYLTTLNPDFLLKLVREYMVYAPMQPIASNETSPDVLKYAAIVLDVLTNSCPGLLESLFLMAKVRFLSGDLKGASKMLHHILEKKDPTFADGHLLAAQIYLLQENYSQAAQSLEVGLSYNFEIRDHPTYHLISGRVLKQQGKYVEAIKFLKTAMSLVGLRPSSGLRNKYKEELSNDDKMQLFLELSDAYRKNGQEQESIKIMQDAMTQFQGMPEESKVTVANGELAMARGDLQEALRIFQAVDPQQPGFVRARERMGYIYMNHFKDKQAFVTCYKSILENQPTAHSYTILGDALMGIMEVDRGIECYEQALKKSPRDPVLTSKLAHAMVKIHQYGKAISYYKEAIKHDTNSSMRYDLAELFMNLRHYDKAEKIAQQAMEASVPTSMDTSELVHHVKVLLLLAKIQEKSGSRDAAIQTLSKARDSQNRVLKRVQVDGGDAILEQKKLICSICCQMARHHTVQREFDKAIKFYKDALNFYADDADALASLAQLYMQVDDLDQCQYACTQVLKINKENEMASIMMADLAFRKNDLETAMFHFQQLLDNHPDHWTAMARLVQVMRRTGNLEDVPQHLEKAVKAANRLIVEPGYNYCKGLYEWYIGNANSALKHFNKARKDTEWGQRSVYNMIEICINPDNDTLGGEVFESVNPEDQFEVRDSRDMALRTADTLLKELKACTPDQMLRHRILGNFLIMATKQKTNVERALGDLMSISTKEYPDHVGAVLGIATAYLLLKQTPRARNQLKRVAKNTWNFEDAEYLERCWLLLADVYVQSGKYDMATELLRRVLNHNKSCTKAYEYMGFIMEKEQSYKDAAFHYEKAWKFSNKTNPTIGYKLAFNYMKAKRFVDAIEVSQAVLAKYPNYPKIRKEILEKSRNNIRL